MIGGSIYTETTVLLMYLRAYNHAETLESSFALANATLKCTTAFSGTFGIRNIMCVRVHLRQKFSSVRGESQAGLIAVRLPTGSPRRTSQVLFCSS
jgi:hypothetical protein